MWCADVMVYSVIITKQICSLAYAQFSASLQTGVQTDYILYFSCLSMDKTVYKRMFSKYFSLVFAINHYGRVQFVRSMDIVVNHYSKVMLLFLLLTSLVHQDVLNDKAIKFLLIYVLIFSQAFVFQNMHMFIRLTQSLTHSNVPLFHSITHSITYSQ